MLILTIILLSLLCCYLGFWLWIVTHSAVKFAKYYQLASEQLTKEQREDLDNEFWNED